MYVYFFHCFVKKTFKIKRKMSKIGKKNSEMAIEFLGYVAFIVSRSRNGKQRLS